VRQKNVVMGPAEPGTKDDCVGEGQQQFTRTDQTRTVRSHDSVKVMRHKIMVLGPNRALNQD
jgi:hypothetical protein